MVKKYVFIKSVQRYNKKLGFAILFDDIWSGYTQFII